MKIYLGADHNGVEYKAKLAEYLKRSGYDVVDEGGQCRPSGRRLPAVRR